VFEQWTSFLLEQKLLTLHHRDQSDPVP